MHIVIASRIYTPEPAAASFMLEAIADEFQEAGHRVTVVTTKPPAGLAIAPTDGATQHAGIEVKRARVLRDSKGYVRGYLSYLSFDIPLFFRLLLLPKPDVYLVEPPPTTAAIVRVIAALKRRPYIYDAADLWSDAAQMVTGSRFVLGALRLVERFGLRGAAHAFAISDGLIERMRELKIATPATAIGFGVNTDAFRFVAAREGSAPYFVYAGSYSEWHGAGIFVDAFAEFQGEFPQYRLLFVGNGAERDALRARATQLGIAPAVEFRDPVEAATLNETLVNAVASLASLKPGQGYDYAFATKVYSSLAAGCPVLFSGVGPTAPFVRNIGAKHAGNIAVSYELDEVLRAMRAIAEAPTVAAERERLSSWARDEFSLARSAAKVVSITSADVTPSAV